MYVQNFGLSVLGMRMEWSQGRRVLNFIAMFFYLFVISKSSKGVRKVSMAAIPYIQQEMKYSIKENQPVYCFETITRNQSLIQKE